MQIKFFGLRSQAGLAMVMMVATLLLTAFWSPANTAKAAGSFYNPLMGIPDPSLVYYNGFYYLTGTYDGDGDTSIRIYKSPSIEGLRQSAPITVFTPGNNGSSECCGIWAASLKMFNGLWYIYYTADDGTDANHRLHVLQSSSSDPLSSYTEKARLYDPNNDIWAIDGTAFQYNNNYYLVWAGWPTSGGGSEDIFIASMSNPYTLSSGRNLISSPSYGWEENGAPINEAPDVLQHNGNLYITYSASGANLPDYALGMLTYTGGNLLSGSSWSKSANPVFSRNDSAGVYGPGSNSFFTSPDGSETWLAYHAKNTSNNDFGDRSVRVQKINWNSDGSPNFGQPQSKSTALTAPSGDQGGSAYNRVANYSFETNNCSSNVSNVSNWDVWPGSNGTDANASYTESYGGSHSGNCHLTHYKNSAYQVYTSQTINGLANGNYNLSAWVESSGGQNSIFMSAKNYGNSVPELTANIPTASNWTRVNISNINVTNGQITVGFYSQANAGNWARFDDVELDAANIVLNNDFEVDGNTPTATNWDVWPGSNGTDANASYVENYQGSQSGAYHLTHYKSSGYQVYTSQTLDNIDNGTYTLTAWVESGGGQSAIFMSAKNYGNSVPELTANVPTTSNWTQITISNINVTNNSITFGFYSYDPNGGAWARFDNVSLTKQ